MIKILNKLGKKGNFLNPVQSIYEKPTANTTLNGEGLSASPWDWEQGKGACSPHLLSALHWGISSALSSKGKKQKAFILEKKKWNCLYSQMVIFYVGNSKKSIKVLLELYNKQVQQGYTI